MLLVVIAVCLGILLGMAIGTKVLALRRRRLAELSYPDRPYPPV